MDKDKSNRMHGFTLIELMVVISLVAIGAGIAMAAFGAMQNKYRTESAAEILRATLTEARFSAMSNALDVEVTINYSSGATAVKNSVAATHLSGIYTAATKIVTGGERSLGNVHIFKATSTGYTCTKAAGGTLKTIRFGARGSAEDLTDAAASILLSADPAGTQDVHCILVRSSTGRVMVQRQ